MNKFHFVALGLGFCLLGFLIWKIGPAALWRDLSLIGWGLVPFVLIEGVSKLFHALGWRRCLLGPYRSMRFSRILAIDLAGHSINYFTPTATIGGEVVRGSLLYAAHKAPEAVTGVIIGKITFVLSQIILASLGSFFFLWKIHMPAAGYAAVLALNILILGGIIGFLLVQKYGKLGALLRWLVARGIGGARLRKGTEEISRVDETLQYFYREHPGRFISSMLWHFTALFFSILKVWYFLFLLKEGSFLKAAGVWFLGTWMDILTFFIPLDIGILEGTRVLIFKALEFSAASGLAFGIALRLDQIFWGGVGLVSYAFLLPHLEKKNEISRPDATDR